MSRADWLPRIGLATPDDAEDYSRCHVSSLETTYAHIMPPAFAANHWRELPEMIAANRDEFAAMADDLAAGREPHRRHWIARDESGEAVGVAASGPGPADWETGFTQPPVAFNFAHLYTLPRTHGTGLGQALMDTALPDDHEAYLWILEQNPRAEAMYVRNGFTREGYDVTCGPSWFGRPMFRMYRTREMAQAARQR